MTPLRIENLNHYNGGDNMKHYVFRYNLMVQDMAGGGINPDLSACGKYKAIDGRNTFVDRQSGLLCCYSLIDGCNYPLKYYVPKSWCEVVDL